MKKQGERTKSGQERKAERWIKNMTAGRRRRRSVRCKVILKSERKKDLKLRESKEQVRRQEEEEIDTLLAENNDKSLDETHAQATKKEMTDTPPLLFDHLYILAKLIVMSLKV